MLTSLFKKVAIVAIALVVVSVAAHAQQPLTYSFWTGIRIDGKLANPRQIREVMSVNPSALKHYNSGRTLEMIGAGLHGVGAGIVLIDMISSDTQLSGIGWLVFASGFAFSIPGTVKIGNSVGIYNSGLRTSHSPPYQINFGITPSGGVGLAMRF